MAGRRMTQAFRLLPMELFRISNGRSTNLREYGPRRSQSYDVITSAGMVQPKALQPATYLSPNGASMRPNTWTQHDILAKFKGSNLVVYAVPAGTPLPESLLLVHEGGDHFSLQAAREMTVADLNNEITRFLEQQGRIWSKAQWLQAYPQATISETLTPLSADAQASQGSRSGSSS